MPNPLSSLAAKVILFALGALSVFGAGMFLGHELGASTWKGRAYQQAQTSSRIILAKEGETQQCRAQIDKANAANRALADELAEKNRLDRAARDKASREAVARDRESRERNKLVMAALEQLRDDITQGNFDACTGTNADSKLIELLNATLTTNRSGDTDGDSGLPPANSAD
jgi:hypothetical protein